jgi:hypothetical protein
MSTPALSLRGGDPSRRALRRAVVVVLVSAVVFMAVELPVKQFLGAYDHAPWSNDPYDAVTSFAVFFVPLVIFVALVRVALCRRAQPLPLSRALGILRCGRVALATIGGTLLAEWVSVVLQANRAEWNGITPWLVVLLALTTIAVTPAWVLLRRAAVRMPREATGASPGPDWFSDVVTLAEDIAAWLGPLARLAGAAIRWLNRWVVASIRRFPIAAAAGAALAFGVLLALNTLLREGAGPALWIDVVVGSTGMFAFLVAAGAYVGLVRRGRPAAGARRRAVDAAVIGCAAVPAALGFREWLWWVVGSDGGSGSPASLGELLLVAALATSCVVFAGETLLRVHRSRTA